MTYSLSSPVTGGAQTGFTAPTYTIVADQATELNQKAWAVTALGGTQTGVTIHSMSSPFTHSFFRPKVIRPVGLVNPVTGAVKNNPRNVFKRNTRKGVAVVSGQPVQTMFMSQVIEVPAGADVVDPANVRAAVSFDSGVLWQLASGLGDTLISGLTG